MPEREFLDLVDKLKKAEVTILRKWEKKVRDELPDAREETTLALRDHLPQFLHDLEKTLETPDSDEAVGRMKKRAESHGIQRANTLEFTLDQVVLEYEILRRTIFDELEVNKPLTPSQREAVLRKISDGVAAATKEFAEVKVSDEKVQKNEAKKSQRHYRDLIDKLDHAIAWEADPETLKFTFVNDRAVELLGYPISEWLNDPNFLEKHLHPDDRQKFQQMIKTTRETGNAVRAECRLIDKKGVEHWFQSGIEMEKDESSQPVLLRGLCVDITPFKRSRQQADEAYAELMAFLRSSPIGAGMIGPDFRYRRINEPLAAINGKPVQEHIGKTVREVLGDRIADEIEPYLKKVLINGETVRFEADATLPNEPGLHHLLVNYYPVKRDDTILGIGATIVDVTRVKETEKELKDSQERYDLALKAADIGVWELYFDKSEIKWSPRQFEIFGVDPKTKPLTFDTFESKIHPDDVETVMAEFGKAVHENRDFKTEYRIKRGDGEIRWIAARGRTVYDQAGKPLRMMGTNIDITDQKRSMEFLKESEARIRTFVAAMPQMAFISDKTGRGIFFNQRHYDYFGIPYGDLNAWYEAEKTARHPDDLPATMERWYKSLATGQSFETEYRLKRRDGQWRWHLGRAEPIRGADGQIIYWFGTNTDIDEQKKNQEQLQRLLADLEIERSLGEQFVASLTHDLRNPLTAIKTNAELLRRYSEKPEAAERTRARILNSVERADRMIEDLLNLYRVRAGHGYPLLKTESDLAQICHDLIDESSILYGDRFIYQGPESLRTHADPKAIRRALENLVGNAAKYGAPEKPIIIALDELEDSNRISVKNEGEPIPQANLEKLFIPFQRLDKTSGKKGWGIGLAQVKMIAEAHGGTIEVESSKDKGTVFRLKLPRETR